MSELYPGNCTGCSFVIDIAENLSAFQATQKQTLSDAASDDVEAIAPEMLQYISDLLPQNIAEVFTSPDDITIALRKAAAHRADRIDVAMERLISYANDYVENCPGPVTLHSRTETGLLIGAIICNNPRRATSNGLEQVFITREPIQPIGQGDLDQTNSSQS